MTELGIQIPRPVSISPGRSGASLFAAKEDHYHSIDYATINGWGNKNHIINGAFAVWQRGVVGYAGLVKQYGADRWETNRGAAGSTFSRVIYNSNGFAYAGRVQRDAGNASLVPISIHQPMESEIAKKLAGQNVVLSFVARADATWTAASRYLQISLIVGTGVDQNPLGAGYTNQATIKSANCMLGTTFKRFFVNATIPATTTELDVFFNFTPTGTAGANDFYDISNVQLEIGTVATQYENVSIGQTLLDCKRYFQIYGSQSLFEVLWPTGYSAVAVTAELYKDLPVEMRAVPALATNAFANYQIVMSNNVGVAITNIVINGAISSTRSVAIDVTSAGLFVPGTWCYLRSFNNLLGLIWLDSEIK